MKAQIDRNKALVILDWCTKKFGKSKHQTSFPKMRFYKSSGMSDKNYEDGLRGWYNDKTNTIIIFGGSNTSMRELCTTMIHEYKHFKLDPEEYVSLHHDLIKMGKTLDNIHMNHPHEKRCIRAERTWGDTCFNQLRNKLYKHL
jgi:hypothetical protein